MIMFSSPDVLGAFVYKMSRIVFVTFLWNIFISTWTDHAVDIRDHVNTEHAVFFKGEFRFYGG